ncbi:TLD domain-containing protein 1 [Amphibalanus amphitrite]|uniref:TLD domain-containing protein 1 n=1 Tax=Amphibalanus amphitrite TaxID=1232801 RepID=A0A6A4WRA6_AMPAM|nr:TLD domain-containing protein 1 [Amphibalanus amphitrite]
MWVHRLHQRWVRVTATTGRATPPPPVAAPVDTTPSFLAKLRDALVARSADGAVSRQLFGLVFPNNETVAGVLFEHFVRRSPASTGEALTPADFVSRCAEVCDLISEHDQVEYHLRAFADREDALSAERLRQLVLQAYDAAMWAHPNTVSVGSLAVDEILGGVAESVLHGRPEVGVADTGGHEAAAAAAGPGGGTCVLERAAASSLTGVHPALVWLLMCSLPECYTRPSSAESLPSLPALAALDPGQAIGRLAQAAAPKHWVSLYSSAEQGLSASRLQHHVLSYRGPTITLVRAEEHRLFCVAADVGWRDSPHYWGGADCMAIQLLPQYQVLCSHQADVMFYNQSARGLPSGLRVGADRKTPAVTVDKDLSMCSSRGAPFRLEGLEVWGCGAPAARDQQIKSQKRDQAAIEQRRKVNIMADTEWGENPDRYLLEMSGAHKSYNYN